MGLPCPTHKYVIELVKQKTEETRARLEAEYFKAQKAEKLAHQGMPQAREEGMSEDDVLDKLEMQEVEKRQRQRESLGKQPLPESYIKPNIMKMGGK